MSNTGSIPLNMLVGETPAPSPLHRHVPDPRARRRRKSGSAAGRLLRALVTGFVSYISGAHLSSSTVVNRYAHVPSHQRRTGPELAHSPRAASPTAVAAREAAAGGLPRRELEPQLRPVRFHARRGSRSPTLSDVRPGKRAPASAEALPFPTMAGCMVCLSTFRDREAVTALPCGHLYHTDCIVPWLSRKATCPCCRAALAPPRPMAGEAGAA
ncbi:RING-H2 finger protein ATL2L [Strigomonas culicis]|uniref:RING-H2 finger protein ATL2L n=1 Tax=Strigomonas culicis TaxID=28005 RepID=S9V180_9TRYP|nr:RING-H2 finger protein ATL2L [Strigomonas culicis]|eukprot:EPY16550.1 RING-H2 finger protein ATL2L [Strigomonas culicis]